MKNVMYVLATMFLGLLTILTCVVIGSIILSTDNLTLGIVKVFTSFTIGSIILLIAFIFGDFIRDILDI